MEKLKYVISLTILLFLSLIYSYIASLVSSHTLINGSGYSFQIPSKHLLSSNKYVRTYDTKYNEPVIKEVSFDPILATISLIPCCHS